MTPTAKRILVTGRVQGVGYRPFVYRLAHRLGVRGWVRNSAGTVEILAQAESEVLNTFIAELVASPPPLARPALGAVEEVTPEPLDAFVIRSSRADAETDAHVPPDYFACEDCQRELRNPADRRFRYPFINCTQCGPRYTIIDRLPYDRPHTSMAGFPLCPDCRAEYENPLDRRFHAEPLACPRCGPRLTYRDAKDEVQGEAALAATVAALKAGRIVAVKGIGGYHLICDAASESAVRRLRARKRRPHKPLAVMVPQGGGDGADWIRRLSAADADAVRQVADPARPIVLCPKGDHPGLAPSVAPGMSEIGLFLPYSPLHHVLLDDFGGPLVATSGNVSGEPVLTEADEVEARLGAVADGFLHHNRPIRRPADDPVYRVINRAPRPLRLGRGCAPLELRLPFTLETPVLAVGGHMKNTVALAWGERVVVSPHIGDLDSPRAVHVFHQVIDDLQGLYDVRAQALVCDAHPHYASTRWARAQALPLTSVYHHYAHAGAVAGEFAAAKPMLVFTWDGTGYGEDGTIWGGEGLLGSSGHWLRVASFRPFRLPGGDKAGREPWRAAAALCWETGADPVHLPADSGLAAHAWRRNINCTTSTSAGRLFDAAASLTGVCQEVSFEGQGPMQLEAVAAAAAGRSMVPTLPLAADEQGCLRADWEPLIAGLCDPGVPVSQRALAFHQTLAETLVAQARAIRDLHGTDTVGLSGGVFQNRLLTELAVRGLERAGFAVRLPVRVPCNDAGLAYGQVVEYQARA